MLVHWGNTNSKHNHSTTAYWADTWDRIPSDKRGDHPCFDPDKDLVLPAWKRPNPGALWLKLWSRYFARKQYYQPFFFTCWALAYNYDLINYHFCRPRKERMRLFYFNGNLGPAYAHGRPEDTCVSLFLLSHKFFAPFFVIIKPFASTNQRQVQYGYQAESGSRVWFDSRQEGKARETASKQCNGYSGTHG